MIRKSNGHLLFLIFSVLIITILFSMFALGHVCSDVLPGGSQYKPGCEPVILTVPGGASQDGNQITLTINFENRQTPYSPATSCGNPWSSTLTGADIKSVSSSPACSGCFSMNNPDSQSIPINTNKNFDVVVTIAANANPGTYTLNFVVGASGISNRNIEVSGVVVEASAGCSGNDDCSGGQICCDTACVDPVCLANADCGTNTCVDYTCSNPGTCSAVCSQQNKPNGAVCTNGNCCSGTCDTTVGNSNYATACRSGPACNGNSWQYNVANDGSLCSGDCTVCDNGLCDNNDDSICNQGETCTSGTCQVATQDECDDNEKECNGQTQYRICDTSGASNVWGGWITCADNICKEPSCSAGTCGETNVILGNDDEACYDDTGCTGGDCKCNGAGLCTSQPSDLDCGDYDGSKTNCDAHSDICKWCAMNDNCYEEDRVECTTTSCNSDGEYCSGCRWRPCPGTDSECSCVNGVCSACGTGKECNDNICEIIKSITDTQTDSDDTDNSDDDNQDTSSTRTRTRTTVPDTSTTITRTRSTGSTESNNDSDTTNTRSTRTRTLTDSTGSQSASNSEDINELDSEGSSNYLYYILILAILIIGGVVYFILKGRCIISAESKANNNPQSSISNPNQNKSNFNETVNQPSPAANNLQIIMSIRNMQAMGYNKERIVKELLNRGYSQEKIDEVLNF